MTDPRLSGLYAITDANLLTDNFTAAIEQALQGGCQIIQYRDKSTDQAHRLQQANIIRQLCDQYQCLFIVNDDIELAKACHADGVHIGKDDQQLATAREHLGDEKIIGVSCYNQIELALAAEQAGADYVAFGAFFSSSIKPDATNAPVALISQAKSRLQIPVCCIGGITANNASELIEAGTDMIAVISDIFASDDIKLSSQTLNKLFNSV